jgi:branched-chain amino acid transport system substrate-binding protein
MPLGSLRRGAGAWRLVLAPAVAVAIAGCTAAGSNVSGSTSLATLRVGVVLPLSGMPADLAGQERLGIQVAADLVNSSGGVQGRQVALDVRDLSDASAAPAVVASIKSEGAPIVLGSYASDLSMSVSTATSNAGLVYWESGAVADQLTGRGLPLVFRVGADGARLGSNSATFASTQLAPLLGNTASNLRVTIVAANDDYAESVADAAQAGVASEGSILAARIDYNLYLPDWPTVLSKLVASRPDVVILAAHILDGEAFREAMIAANVHVGALIGSTMAQCVTDFGEELGPDAVGVFASDRPTGGFNPDVLSASARSTYDRLATAWRAAGNAGEPSEEALAGFTAAWALFADVLPHTSALDPQSIAAAARAVDLPEGSLPNGSGLRFSSDPNRLGQNELAAAVVWQWRAGSAATADSAGKMAAVSNTVWPPQFATTAIDTSLVPLPR